MIQDFTFRRFAVPAVAAAAMLSGCVTPPVGPGHPGAIGPAAPAIEKVAAEDWPRMTDELPLDPLIEAAKRNTAYLESIPDKTYLIGATTVTARQLAAGTEALIAIRRAAKTPDELTARLKSEFDLYRLSGGTVPGQGFFTAYYQPVLQASPTRTDKFRYPLYRKPADMLIVDLAAFNPKYKGETLVARVTPAGQMVPYFDRRDIDVRKSLEGRHLEVAWLENQFDRLDVHIQGSALLQFPNGKLMAAKFAGTNALPYKSVGLSLAGSGAIPREEINKASLKKYLADHPEGEAWLLSQNPRYTFFDVEPVEGDGEGHGAIGQRLVPGRSIAVDPRSTPLGAAAFIRLPFPHADAAGQYLGQDVSARLVFCQDTGGAIQGPGRVDVYLGHGELAKAEASHVLTPGDVYLLIKKFPPRER